MNRPQLNRPQENRPQENRPQENRPQENRPQENRPQENRPQENRSGVLDRVAPSRTDPVARGASAAIGGPLGRHARVGTQRFWTPLRVLLALTLVALSLGWLQKSPCREHAWTEGYQYSRLCYSDVRALYFSERLDQGAVPYADHPVEYPVVIGGLMWVASTAVRPLSPADRPVSFYDLTAVLLAGCALVVTWTTMLLAGRRRPWDAALVALAPTLVVHGTTNWDLAAVALAGAGLLAWGRRRPVLAGVLIGLGAATKLYPVLLLGPLLLLCVRAGRLRAWSTCTLAAVAAWLAVNLPVALAYPDAWSRFFTLNSRRGADWDSLWYLLERARGGALDGTLAAGQSPTRLNVASFAVLLALLAGVAWLALAAPRRPRVAQLAFLTVAAFLLANKVFSPQYVLWLTPLAALARPSWRAFLAWQATEAALWFFRLYFFLSFDHPDRAVTFGWFAASVVVRDLALAGYAALVVRDVLRPDVDPVRTDGVDDPAGGVLDAAPDRVLVGRRRVLEARNAT